MKIGFNFLNVTNTIELHNGTFRDLDYLNFFAEHNKQLIRAIFAANRNLEYLPTSIDDIVLEKCYAYGHGKITTGSRMERGSFVVRDGLLYEVAKGMLYSLYIPRYEVSVCAHCGKITYLDNKEGIRNVYTICRDCSDDGKYYEDLKDWCLNLPQKDIMTPYEILGTQKAIVESLKDFNENLYNKIKSDLRR